MPWTKTGATHYHAQLGLIIQGLSIKGVVVYGANGRFTPQLERCMFQGAWRGLEPEATPSPQQGIELQFK